MWRYRKGPGGRFEAARFEVEPGGTWTDTPAKLKGWKEGGKITEIEPPKVIQDDDGE